MLTLQLVEQLGATGISVEEIVLIESAPGRKGPNRGPGDELFFGGHPIIVEGKIEPHVTLVAIAHPGPACTRKSIDVYQFECLVPHHQVVRGQITFEGVKLLFCPRTNCVFRM